MDGIGATAVSSVGTPLGRGQFGDVYKEYNEELKQHVAVKELDADNNGIRNERVFQLAISEIKTILHLHNHANIIHLFDFTVRRNKVRIITEYCQYGTLKNYLKEKKLDLIAALRFMQQGASAIAYMHKRDPPIAHRDIKSKNILVKAESYGDVLKIIDFGMAWFYHSGLLDDLRHETDGKMNKKKDGENRGLSNTSHDEKGGNLTALDVLMLGRVFKEMLEDCANPKSATTQGQMDRNADTKDGRADDGQMQLMTAKELSVKQQLGKLISDMTEFNATERKPIFDVDKDLTELLNDLLTSFGPHPFIIQKNESESTWTKPKLNADEAAIQHTQHVHFKEEKNDARLGNVLGCLLRRKKQVPMTDFPYSLSLINDKLWSCQPDGISIYDRELRGLEARVPCGDLGMVRGAANIGDGKHVVVVTFIGLLVLKFSGELAVCISEGTFTDVCIHNGVVYVASSETPHSPIHAYTVKGPIDETSSWVLIQKFRPPCEGQHHHTMRFNDSYAILACRDKKTVYKMTDDFQQMSSCCSSKEMTADFEAPYICQIDCDGTMMIADLWSSNIQILHENKWYMLQLDPKPYRPRSAIYFAKGLYIVENDKTLSMYQVGSIQKPI